MAGKAGRKRKTFETGQITITLPASMLVEMRNRRDINWSGVAEIAFRKVLEQPCALQPVPLNNGAKN